MRSVCRVLVLALSLAAGAAPSHAQASRTATTYVVRGGDTLFRISRETGVSVGELMRLNGLTSDRIEIGQTLRLSALVALPPRPPTGADGTPAALPAGGMRRTHVVQPGETLFRIAGQYGTTVEEIRRLNGLVGDNIAAGQRLTVPSGGAPSGPTAATTEPARPSEPADLPGAATYEPPPLTLGPWRVDNTTVPADLVHFVEPGETIYSIAVRYGVSSDAFAAANQLTTAPLEPGTLLVLPRAVDPSVPHELALPPADESGLALVYDRAASGQTTASGEPHDPRALTAAHRDAPIGSVLLVTNTASGRSVFVRVNDRGPLSSSYLIELSEAAARTLELDGSAQRRVEVRRIP